MADGRFILQNLDLDYDSESELEFPEETEQPVVEVRAMSLEDVMEKAILEDIIIEKEHDYLQNFIRSSSSPEEGHRKMEEIYYTAQKEVGYHVDVWPPKPVTATLQVEKVMDVSGEQRLTLLRNKIDTFSTRLVLDLERKDDAYAIIVQDEQAGRAIVHSEAFQEFQTVAIFGTQYDNAHIHVSKAPEGDYKKVLVINADLVTHGLYAFASLVILHGFTDTRLFRRTVSRLTEGSRIQKRESVISVPLNVFDEPTIIECAATLLGARGEQITDKFLDFVEESCWIGKPQEKSDFRSWETSVKAANLARDYEISRFLGVRVEFWWNVHETLKKVETYVQPANENHDYSERPWANHRQRRGISQ